MNEKENPDPKPKKERKKKEKKMKDNVLFPTALTEKNREELRSMKNRMGWPTIWAMLRDGMKDFTSTKPWTMGFTFENPPNLFKIKQNKKTKKKIMIQSEYTQYNLSLDPETKEIMEGALKELEESNGKVSRRTFIFSMIRWWMDSGHKKYLS